MRTLLALTISLFALHTLTADDVVEKYRTAAVTKWADEMKRIAKLDEKEKDPDNAILFLGSSSIGCGAI